MAAEIIGKNWNPIWEAGVWNLGMWSQNGGVSIGRAWAPIWNAGVWASGVWATTPILPPTLYPMSLISTFEWTASEGTIIEALTDGLDTTYIQATDVGSVVAFTLTQSPFTTVTGATLSVRSMIQ